MSHQGITIVKVHEAAVALADVAGEVQAAHVLKQIVGGVHMDVAKLAQRMLLLMPLQLLLGEVAQLQRKDSVCLWSMQGRSILQMECRTTDKLRCKLGFSSTQGAHNSTRAASMSF